MLAINDLMYDKMLELSQFLIVHFHIFFSGYIFEVYVGHYRVVY